MLKVEKASMKWSHHDKLHDTIRFNQPTEDQVEREAIKSMLSSVAVEKLQRYETTIERSIFKTLHELQRLQAARLGESPTIPIAVDIDVQTTDTS